MKSKQVTELLASIKKELKEGNAKMTILEFGIVNLVQEIRICFEEDEHSLHRIIEYGQHSRIIYPLEDKDVEILVTKYNLNKDFHHTYEYKITVSELGRAFATTMFIA